MAQGGPMSSDAWVRTMVCLMLCPLLTGCDGAKLCQQCDRQLEVVRGRCADCDSAEEILIQHTTFAFRFAPPWFNSDQRSLFTSYVVFPEEAKLEEWLGEEANEGCPRKDGRTPSSVCPDTGFYRRAMGPFLKGLSQCATDKKVELRTVGFASSTRLNDVEEDDEAALRRRYAGHLAAMAADCVDKEKERLEDISLMFNLLIANERAVNAAAMLWDIVPKEAKDDFDIRAEFWCSHASMEAKRAWDDHGDTTIGLMNRRAEVRLAALPGCVDIYPDNWLGKTD